LIRQADFRKLLVAPNAPDVLPMIPLPKRGGFPEKPGFPPKRRVDLSRRTALPVEVRSIKCRADVEDM